MSAKKVQASVADQYHFADFTWANYRRLLRLAKKRYRFCGYLEPMDRGRMLLWRHDVDFSMDNAVRCARIEAEEAVATTYFILFHSGFYNLLDAHVRSEVEEIIGLGHHVALHFDADYYGIRDTDDLICALSFERDLIRKLLGCPVEAFAFHMPSVATEEFRDPEYAGLVNATAERFHRDVGFCSDSNGYWRGRRLEDVLREGSDQRLQVLTHPVWWQAEPASPADRLRLSVDESGREMLAWYERVAAQSGRKVAEWE
jgi:hypothetical protein